MKSNIYILISLLVFFTVKSQSAQASTLAEFRFAPSVQMCYVDLGDPAPCQWAINDDTNDRVGVPIELISEKNGIETWKGRWKLTLMAAELFFTYTVDVTKTVIKSSGKTNFELIFGISNSRDRNTVINKVKVDSLEKLNSVKMIGAQVIDKNTERFPHLFYGPI